MTPEALRIGGSMEAHDQNLPGSDLQALGDLLAAAGLGVALLDGEGRLRHVNATYAGWLGLGPEDLAGVPWIEVEADGTQGEEGGYRARHRHRDGTLVDLEVRSLASGWGALRILRDIREEIRRERMRMADLQRMQFLLAQQGEGCAIVDDAERFIYVNPAAEVIFGVSSGALLGRSLMSFLECDQADLVAAKTRERRQGVRDRYELIIRRPDGGRRILWVTATPDLGEEGGHQGTIGVFRDITERREAEDRLRASEARFRALLEQAPLGIAMTRQGRYLYANGAYARLHGLAGVEDLLGQPILDRVHPEDREAFLAFPGRLEAGEVGDPTLTFRAQRQDGSSFPVMATVGRLQLEDGPAFLGFMVDVTERERTTREREALIADLQRALSQVHTLQGLLPICAHCKKIRDDRGYWNQIETYIASRSTAAFTHGICPDCLRAHFPELGEA